jgi:predicted HTH domain antitoxin
MSIVLDFDEELLSKLPLGPGERERHMRIELACRYYQSGWLSFSEAAHLAGVDQFSFGKQLAERKIPRQYGMTEALEDLENARRK